MIERLRRAMPALVGLTLFFVALEVLRHELRVVTWNEITADVTNLPPARLAAAIALTAINYAILAGYDLLAFRYIARPLSALRITLVAWLAYAIANSVGFAALSGASVRYRYYTRMGVTAAELSLVVLFYSVTFWVGLMLLGGLALIRLPLTAVAHPLGRGATTAIGVVLVGLVAGYAVLMFVQRGSIALGRLRVALPSPQLGLLQIVVSVADWIVAALVLFVILPAPAPPFPVFLGAFLAAMLIGLVSHVPGGIGVFEGILAVLVRDYVPAARLVPAMVAYRAIYYLLPFSVALVALAGDEVLQRRRHAAQFGALVSRVAEQLTPRILSALTFFTGVVLLLSGATPATAGRLEALSHVMPLGLIEASHFLASIAGAALLLLSQAIARRLDAGYYLTVATIGAGMMASLVKGFDYEEAIVLSFVLAALYRSRRRFDRRAALFATRFTPEWIAAVSAATGTALWLARFAFKHVEYSRELWWQFELYGEASRSLRASVGAAVVLLLFAVWRLVRHAPHDLPAPDDADLAAAAAIIERVPSTAANLVFLGDKAILFDDTRDAFLMYGVQGRTWVALGDPVGPPDRAGPLIRRFLERCEDEGGTPVFYGATALHLHRYADVGLTFAKLGEQARVDLTRFSLEGGAQSKLRQAARRLEKDGASFRVIEPGALAPLLPELRGVSDDWLAHKSVAEKGFSLGFFDETYVARFPIGVIERGGAIAAFANVWRGADRAELSIDLMRYHHDAPRDAMETLLVHLMLWGKREGYRWFDLGMAPLAGVESSPVAPLWNRISAFVYAHGERVYNFQGLRTYKEKFHPVWTPHYLAYPGGFRLARILTDVAALIAGGYGRIFLK